MSRRSSHNHKFICNGTLALTSCASMLEIRQNIQYLVGFEVLTAVVMKSTTVLLSLLFDPEDGGDMFLRNVG
jgi:hypothetical protein